MGVQVQGCGNSVWDMYCTGTPETLVTYRTGTPDVTLMNTEIEMLLCSLEALQGSLESCTGSRLSVQMIVF